MPHYNHRNNDLGDIDERIFEYNNYNANYNFVRPIIRSPIHSPIRSTIRSPMRSPIRSSIRSPLHSPLRSPIRSILRSPVRSPIISPSHSPIRDSISYLKPKKTVNLDYYEIPNQEDILKLKWTDNSPRMSRLRDQRSKRLLGRLEQFEQWDAEQEQKQKQFELAREQRYKNIVERLKTQDFCLNQMRRRHESDIETTRELEPYEKEHIYLDALDNPKEKQHGPLSEFRKFEAEMDDKLKVLEDEIDSVNPRVKIEQSLLPRLERTRDTYSVEPEIFTTKGKRVLKRPKLNGRVSEDRDSNTPTSHTKQFYDDDSDLKGIKYYYAPPIDDEELFEQARILLNKDKFKNTQNLKPIIANNVYEDPAKSISKLKISNGNEKHVIFKDDLEQKNHRINNGRSNDTLKHNHLKHGDNKHEINTNKTNDNNNNNGIEDELAAEMVVKNDTSMNNDMKREENIAVENLIQEMSNN